MNRKEVREQIDYVIAQERKWSDLLDKQDSGSYCESPSSEHDKVLSVWRNWRNLLSAMMAYEEDM